MNKMKILVTYAGVWKMDNGQSGMTLNDKHNGRCKSWISLSRVSRPSH